MVACQETGHARNKVNVDMEGIIAAKRQRTTLRSNSAQSSVDESIASLGPIEVPVASGQAEHQEMDSAELEAQKKEFFDRDEQDAGASTSAFQIAWKKAG